MADIDLKALTPGSAAASSVIVGAANTSAASPSLFTTTGSGNVVLSDGTLSVTTAKTFTVNNTLTFAGTDGSTLNIGTGGTLGALATVTPGTGVATAATNAVNTTAGFITFATFAPASGKTLTLSNTLTLAGTDGTTMTFPSTSATLARTDAGNTFTSNQTFTGSIVLNGATSGTVTLGVPATAGTTTFTLPSSNGTNGFILTTNGSGITSWTNPTSLGIDLDVGTTALTSGTVGRVLFEGAGNVLQESANLTFSSSALTLGVAGSATGSVVLAGSTSGTVTLQPAAAAGTGTIFQFPATNGTANYALTTNGSGVTSWSQISLTAGVTGALPLANGGTNANLTASNGGIVYSDASAFAVLSGTATAGQILRSGASGAPSWSTATFPSTASSTGTLLRADGTNWVATTATFPNTAGTSGTFIQSNGTNWINSTVVLPTTTTAGTLLTSATANTISGSATPTLGVAGTTAGTLALSGATSGTVTLQTAAVAGTGTIFQFPATNGASGTILTTTGSGVTTWSTATFPSTATSAGTILRADGTNWVATTATYPTTTTANQLLYSSASNTVGGLTSANTSALVTNSSGVPSFTSGTTANRVLRTDGTTVSFAQVGLTTDVTGTLPVGNGGTGTSTTFTTGSVVFAGASGVYSQNNSNLFWDNTNGRLAVGFTSPLASLDIVGSNWTRGGASAGGVLILSSDATSGANGSTIESSFLSGGYGPLIVKTNGAESLRINTSGKVLIGTTTAGASKLTVADDSIQINTAKTPASATATGTTGQLCWDASYIYVCTATNTWKRAAIATW